MKDGPVLFYCKDGELYPVAMSNEQQQKFELACRVVQPLKVVINLPQAKAINLMEGRGKG